MGNRPARQPAGLQGYGGGYDPNYGMEYYGGSYDPYESCKYLLFFLSFIYDTYVHILLF
jgi:hypothetical protein